VRIAREQERELESNHVNIQQPPQVRVGRPGSGGSSTTPTYREVDGDNRAEGMDPRVGSFMDQDEECVEDLLGQLWVIPNQNLGFHHHIAMEGVCSRSVVTW
jgi:hypothetical protein